MGFDVATFGAASAVVVASVAALTGIRIAADAYFRRAKRAAPPPQLEQRLSHIENAVDAIAVEVERISEGQRFTARLEAERARTHAIGS